MAGQSTNGYAAWFQLLGLPLVYSEIGNYPYLGGVYHCPLNQGIETSQTDTNGVKSAGVTQPSPTYGYNAWGTALWTDRLGLGGYSAGATINTPLQASESTRESAVLAPSEMIALADGFNRSNALKLDGAQSIDGRVAPQTINEALVSRTPYKQQASFKAHHGRAIRAFADGHLEVEDLRNPFLANDDQLSRWNVDPQPHRNLLQN